MDRPDSGMSGRLARAMNPTGLRAKAKQAAAALKAEYEAGKQGDDAPAAPIWPTPKEQLDGLLALLGVARGHVADSAPGIGADGTSDGESHDVEADEVAAAMRGVDWAGVRAATAERGGDAATAMRTMAQQVDWTKVQHNTARMSSALIAAVAAGQIPIGGRLGSTVARTLVDQRLAQRVTTQLQAEPATAPPDFRGAIEATSRES